MFDDKKDIKFILETVMGGKPIEKVRVEFVMEDFPEGKKIIIKDGHLFEVLKVENDTVVIKLLGTSLLSRETLNHEEGIITVRYIKDGKIVEIQK